VTGAGLGFPDPAFRVLQLNDARVVGFDRLSASNHIYSYFLHAPVLCGRVRETHMVNQHCGYVGWTHFIRSDIHPEVPVAYHKAFTAGQSQG
jgi:hypothetical protein